LRNDRGMNPGAPELVRCGAKAIMEIMGGVDIDASLKFFDSKGGYCDCEIRYNVDTGPGSSEEDDQETRDLTSDESRWFDEAVEALKPLEPIRKQVESRLRTEEASRVLKPLLEKGLTADEFRAALKMLPGNALLKLTSH
jgi:hypothetical protein